ncbi:MAG TPA: NAD(P)/FAD-dependent oxidoreductase, partial [Gammaproteobacteria bacterium]|nr:NAD(P)/FAD-dependent oxidoreductase [Gammaproteobacteria bacterium]
HCGPDNFLSHNPHFFKSALSRYTPYGFIALVEKHGIAYHEKKLGQLFCDNSAKDIVKMLLAECEAAGAEVRSNTRVLNIQTDSPHILDTSSGEYQCESLVIATGGLSIPTMGATGFGYEFAKQLGIRVWPTRAGLVPFTLDEKKKQAFNDLSGVSTDAEASANGEAFRENILFTHRGLSGPAVLQISSFWQPGESVALDLLPGKDLRALLETARQATPKQMLKTFLGYHWPKRMAEHWCNLFVTDKPLGEMSNTDIAETVDACQPWQLKPAGTEGYRTAEVTLGGVDTDAVSSKTFACHEHPGIYFIGEVLDVTGHLGGHNFQWAWASGHAAGGFV